MCMEECSPESWLFTMSTKRPDATRFPMLSDNMLPSLTN